MKLMPRIIKNNNGLFQLQDDENHTLQSKAAQRAIDRYDSYFQDRFHFIFRSSLTYVQLLNCIKRINHSLSRKNLPQIVTSNKFNDFVTKRRYYIKEQSEAGLTIKDEDQRWNKEFDQFKTIVNHEVSRPLKLDQERASFFLSIMKRAANFSVPGSGKTAMMYGAFAYLSSPKMDKVNRILIISPLNAFAAWRTEFTAVFGSKKQLHYLNLRDKKYNSNKGAIIRDWMKSNIITINYESLQNKVNILNELIDEKTMLVFDEVHRIKGINGKRAKASLSLSKDAHYRYVLTGTPIPNGYKDVYNFLHLMYPDEYNGFFAWDLNELEKADPEIINRKLAPFFWRTNKKDLHVPKPDPDKIIKIEPSRGQEVLANAIYSNEKGALATFIRLLQASTNPELLKKNINYQELGIIEGESNEWDTNFSKVKSENISDPSNYKKFDLSKMRSPKFDAGIELIKKLISEHKKVLVWAMFVGTMRKIKKVLDSNGISNTLIYGETPKDQRELLIDEFKNGLTEVLITNPNTLGESISLHKTVHDAVYFEYNFNLTFMLQSRDRINRLGLPQDQYTRYYYLMSKGNRAHEGFIDELVYHRLKAKEKIMLSAIEGKLLVPEYTDDYLEEVKKIVLK